MTSTQGVVVGLVVFATLLYSGQTQLNRACLNRLDVLIVFDSSGSVSFNNFYNWEMVKKTSKSYLSSFQIGVNQVHVALMQVSDRTTILSDFTNLMTRQEIERAIDGMQLGSNTGGTNLAGGFETAFRMIFDRAHGMRDNVKGVLLLFSDGIATVRVQDTIPLATRLKLEKNIMIVPIAISGQVDMKLLKEISSSTDQPIVTFDELYIASNFFDSQLLEICVLLDASGSITFLDFHNWWYAKLFLEYIFTSLWTDPTRLKVSLITFNETARMQIRMGELNNLNDLLGAVRALQHYGGSTNIAAAMQMVHTQVFPEALRQQNGLKRLVLLITDGMPTHGKGGEETVAMDLKRKGVEIVSVVVKGRKQIDRTRLRRLASIISSSGVNLKPAVIDVTDYRGLAAKQDVVLDTICSIPPSRSPASDLDVRCYKTCYDQPGGRRLWEGNYHYCEFGSIQREEECRNYLYCPKNPNSHGIMIVCPIDYQFDDSLKVCVWKSCSCPGNKRKCFRPRI